MSPTASEDKCWLKFNKGINDVFLSCLPVSFYGDLIEKRMTWSEWFKLAVNLNLDGIDFAIHLLNGHGSCPD